MNSKCRSHHWINLYKPPSLAFSNDPNNRQLLFLWIFKSFEYYEICTFCGAIRLWNSSYFGGRGKFQYRLLTSKEKPKHLKKAAEWNEIIDNYNKEN